MEQDHEERERKDISEEGEFEENEGYGNPFCEGDNATLGDGKLI